MNTRLRAKPKSPSIPIPFFTLKQSRFLQRKCACGSSSGLEGECAQCREKRLQRRAGNSAELTSVPPIVYEVLRSPGQPLAPQTRACMESRFGHDFSKVRMHNDVKASESAKAVNAHAYTVGSHIVFAQGRSDSNSAEGKRLLAHELAHVVQQRGSSATFQPALAINKPSGKDEIEAEAAADQFQNESGGRPPIMQHMPVLQRAVSETPQKHLQRGAQVCMVHLHGDEQNALEVAKSMHLDFCANLVHLNNTGRCITFNTSTLKGCSADPNRIFSKDSVTRANAFTGECPCPASKRSQAVRELRQFHNDKLAPAISRCRGGRGQGLAGRLPVVALHNNTPNERTPKALSIESFMRKDPRTGKRGAEFGATETSRRRLRGVRNPSRLRLPASSDPHNLRDVDNFLLVTNAADFRALHRQFNVVLQSTNPHDDGSLSVALAGDANRYINVEAQNKPFTSAADPFFITNRQMAEAVFKRLGVSRKPCMPPKKRQRG